MSIKIFHIEPSTTRPVISVGSCLIISVRLNNNNSLPLSANWTCPIITAARYEINDEFYLTNILTTDDISSMVKYLNNTELIWSKMWVWVRWVVRWMPFTQFLPHLPAHPPHILANTTLISTDGSNKIGKEILWASLFILLSK
jgi:hypothetical protein